MAQVWFLTSHKCRQHRASAMKDRCSAAPEGPALLLCARSRRLPGHLVGHCVAVSAALTSH
eukprot:901401-Rhodomonas_salina.3